MTQSLEQHIQQAEELIISAEEHSKNLLEGKDLRPFLKLMVRLPEFDVHNLLLIMEQYPRATFLARSSYWKAKASSDAVLRPEWAGKGIDLVLPILNVEALVGYSTRFYDVLQLQCANKLDVPSTFLQVSDVRTNAETYLVHFGDAYMVPDSEVEFESDFLLTPRDSSVAAMASRYLTAANYYLEELNSDILSVLLTQAIIIQCGYESPALTEEGEELLVTDDPISFLALLKDKHAELTSALGL